MDCPYGGVAGLNVFMFKKHLLEFAPYAMGKCDGQLVFRYLNPVIESVVGYRPDQLLGHPLLEFAHPDDVESIRQAVRAMKGVNGTTTLVARLKHSQASWVNVELLMRKCRIRNSQVCWLIYLRDLKGRSKVFDLIRMERDLLVQLSRLKEPAQMMQAVLTAALSMESVHAGCVYQYDGRKRNMTLIAAEGLPARMLSDIGVFSPRSLQVRHARSGPAIYLTDRDRNPFRSFLREHGIKSAAILPMRQDGRVYGVLCLHHMGRGQFTVQDRLTMESLARYATLALQNHARESVLRQNEEKYRGLAEARQLLARRLLEVQEQERKHVSDFLHGHMGPLIIAAKLDLDDLVRRSPDRRELVDRINLRMDEALRGIRAKALAVHPPLLDDLAVNEALEFLVEEVAHTAGCDIALAPVPALPALSAGIKTCLYRVLEEALQNVTVHAKATRTWVEVHKRGHQLRMRVRDNGVGFLPKAVSNGKSLGLMGMREIVESFHGSLKVVSRPGHGTLVEVMIPITTVRF